LPGQMNSLVSQLLRPFFKNEYKMQSTAFELE
jgi:hypothetical protein